MNPMRTFVVVLSLIGLFLPPMSFAGQHEGTTERGVQAERLQVHRARVFLGGRVENSQGEDLGTIDDLVINPADGRIIYATLSYGRILGLGGKFFAMPWKALQLQPDGKTFILNITKEKLDKAPGFDKGTWPQQPDPMLSIATQGTPESTTHPQAKGAQPSSTIEVGRQTEAILPAIVQDMDSQQEMLILRSSNEETVDLRAPVELLIGLQAGDAVELPMVGKAVRATQ